MKVLVADDELLARKRMRRLLAALDQVEVVAEATDGAQVLALLADHEVDVVLLDIHMPGLSGVEAMQLWPEDGPAIVFITAHADHAVDAFAGGAVDYVLKPVEPARLRQALERVRGRRQSQPTDRIALSTRKGLVLLRPDEVVSVRIDGASTVVSGDRGEVFTELALSELERRLGPGFRRVHRQALVNMDRVLRFEDNGRGGYIAHTDDGGRVRVSRKAARQLRRELDS